MLPNELIKSDNALEKRPGSWGVKLRVADDLQTWGLGEDII
jgi:hypothetical protein